MVVNIKVEPRRAAGDACTRAAGRSESKVTSGKAPNAPPPPVTTADRVLGHRGQPRRPSWLFGSSLGHSVTGIGDACRPTPSMAFAYKFSPTGISNTVPSSGQPEGGRLARRPSAFVSPVGIVRIAHQATQDRVGRPSLYLLAIMQRVRRYLQPPAHPSAGREPRSGRLLREGAQPRQPRRIISTRGNSRSLLYAGLVVILVLGLSALFLDLRDLLT